jgi:DivIVA domain-containing protein
MKKKEQPSAESPFATGASQTPRLTAEDIQAKEFRIARLRGYKERDVDEFLDELTMAWSALLDENRRLRSQEGGMSSIGAPDVGDAARQADEIIARARQEAGRIVAEAEVTSGVRRAGADDRAAVSSFLTKERAFLQELATLVQGHAEGMKSMAREAFAKPAAAPPPAAQKPTASEPAASEPTASEPTEPPADETPAAEAAAAVPAAAVSASPTTSKPAPVQDDEPIRVDEPQTASVRGHEEESGDRSLKELFWGEE